MYNEIQLIEHLSNNTPYTVDYFTGTDSIMESMRDNAAPTSIYVSVGGGQLLHPQFRQISAYGEYDENIVCTSNLTMILPRLELEETLRVIRSAYSTFYPQGSNGEYSRTNFYSAKTLGATKHKIVWDELIYFIMPRVP